MDRENKVYNIGTRASKLALAQTKLAINHIKSFYPSFKCKIIEVQTTGDRIIDKPLYDIGGKALFTKELESALACKEIDIAIHSAKDIEANFENVFSIPCVLKREDPRDVLVSSDYSNLLDIPHEAVIGTCSLRRQAQIMLLRPDLKFVDLRGNINTRIDKCLNSGGMDGIILAAAGLKRIGLSNYIKQYFDYSELIPSPCQGIIALQTRATDDILNSVLSNITDKNTHYQFTLERAFIDRINGSCRTPLGCISEVENGQIKAQFILFDTYLKLIGRIAFAGNVDDAMIIGVSGADSLL